MDSHFSCCHLQTAQERTACPINVADFGEKLQITRSWRRYGGGRRLQRNVLSLFVFVISLSIPLAISSSPSPSLTTVHKKNNRKLLTRKSSVLVGRRLSCSTEGGKLLVLCFSFFFFARPLFQSRLGCLIKCSFPLSCGMRVCFLSALSSLLLQSTHMVCLSVYDFSYSGVVRFLNHLSSQGQTVHI